MEALSCRSFAACRVCPHSDRAGACALEAALDVALEALAPQRPPLIVVSSRASRVASA